MKIPLRLSFFLVLMPLIANAQAPFRIGAYGGINFSNIMVLNRHSVLQPTPTIVDREAKQYEDWFSLDHMGFQAGLISLIALNDQVYLVPMLRYSQHSFRYDTRILFNDTASADPLVMDQRFRQQFQYLQLPVMVRWDILPNDVSPFLSLGGYIGFLTGGTKQVDERFLRQSELPALDDDIGFIRAHSGPASNPVSNFDAGAMGGIGVRWRTNALEVGFMADFRWGLTPPILASRRYANTEGWATGYLDVFDEFATQHMDLGFYMVFAPGNIISASPSNYANCSFGQKSKKRKRLIR